MVLPLGALPGRADEELWEEGRRGCGGRGWPPLSEWEESLATAQGALEGTPRQVPDSALVTGELWTKRPAALCPPLTLYKAPAALGLLCKVRLQPLPGTQVALCPNLEPRAWEHSQEGLAPRAPCWRL